LSAGLRLIAVIGIGFVFMAVASPASAGPTTSDHQWINVGGSYCVNPSTGGASTCSETGSGYIDPASEFTHPQWQSYGIFQGGGGSTSANTLGVFSKGNYGTTRTVAMVEDTYLLSGPAGTVSIGVNFSASGSFDITRTYIHPYENGRGNAYLDIGTSLSRTGSTAGTYISGSIYGANDDYTTGYIVNSGGNQNLHYAFDMLATHTMNVSAGSSFSLAFSYIVTGTGGVIGNGLGGGLIDFVLPEGYTLTSDLGWTSPSASSVPTSEPTALVIFGLGLAGLGAMRRHTVPSRTGPSGACRRRLNRCCWRR
jgi:hypothetical protein